MKRRIVAAICLALFALVVIAPAFAYVDYEFDFEVRGPREWRSLPASSVPGSFRTGWVAPDAAKTRYDAAHHPVAWGSGANIAVFVQQFNHAYTAKELLEKNISVIHGVKFGLSPGAQTNIDPRADLKVINQRLFTIDGKQGFVLEVTGTGTGFAIGVPRQPAKTPATGKGQSLLKMMLTRQRWYCVVRGKTLIGVLSTCSNASYPRYVSAFHATEKSLRVH